MLHFFFWKSRFVADLLNSNSKIQSVALPAPEKDEFRAVNGAAE